MMPSASSSASTSASRLVSHIARISSGRVPATRVASANEDAASDSASAPPCSPTWASARAIRCGRCEIRATAASWACGSAGTTRLPTARARRGDRRPVVDVAVVGQAGHPGRAVEQGRLDPAAQPEAAVPAIGCEPMYLARGASSATSSCTAAFTLATSVSRTVGRELVDAAQQAAEGGHRRRQHHQRVVPRGRGRAPRPGVSATSKPSPAAAARVAGAGRPAEHRQQPACAPGPANRRSGRGRARTAPAGSRRGRPRR